MTDGWILTVTGWQYEIYGELMEIGIKSPDFNLYSVPTRVPPHTTIVFKNNDEYNFYRLQLPKERIVD